VFGRDGANPSQNCRDPYPLIFPGIDSFQVVHPHGRFWIASLLFDHEQPGVTLPPKYLKKAVL
jgi:hypothetical protein